MKRKRTTTRGGGKRVEEEGKGPGNKGARIRTHGGGHLTFLQKKNNEKRTPQKKKKHVSASEEGEWGRETIPRFRGGQMISFC